jgi:hypothetical protein
MLKQLNVKENVERNNWNVEIIVEPFSLEHLKFSYDFMKTDGEGPATDLWNLIQSEGNIDTNYRKGEAEVLRYKYFARLNWLLNYPSMWKYWFQANKRFNKQPFKLISKLHHLKEVESEVD